MEARSSPAPKGRGQVALRFRFCLPLLACLGLLSAQEVQAQVFTKVGSFIAPTAGPPTSAVTGVGFTPKAVIFFWTSQTATGFASSAAIGYGFATAPGFERAIAFVSDDNIYPNNPVRWQWTNRSFVVMNSSSAGTTNCEGQLNSMDADGFTISWAKKGSAWIIHYMAIGGPDILNSTVGSFTPGAGTGSEAVTGVGFQPDFLMFLSNDSNTVGASVTDAKVAIGFAGLTGGSTLTQGAITAASRSGGVNIITNTVQDTGLAILEKAPNIATITFSAAVTSFDANGFTLNKIINAGGTETTTHYLALQGGQYRVGTLTKPYPTEAPPSFPQSYTGVGFTPHGLLFVSWNHGGQSIPDEEARISFSAADTRGSPPNQRATFFHDKLDTPANSDNSWVTEGTLGTDVSNGQVIYLAQAGDCPPNPLFSDPAGSAQCSGPARLISSADVTSFDADGFTLNWTMNDNTNANQAAGDEDNAQILYLALGNDETTAVTLTSFTAKGDDGSVLLEWESASEIRNLGFNIYRAEAEEGPYERINASPIAGLGTSSIGASYTYRDSNLTNGRAYFYELEDIETTGHTEMHGPVVATPHSAEKSPSIGESSPDQETALVAYGDSLANRFKVLSWSSRGAVLELVTEGFHAEPVEDGTVRLSIPGFDLLSEPGRMSIPVTRPWVPATAGLGVRLLSVEEKDVEVFAGLRPSGAEVIDVVGARDGTVRLHSRRRGRAISVSEPYPENAARILSTGFQGDVKKVQLELAPLRWDGRRGKLILAKRLLVRLAFQGPLREESALGDKRGRRFRSRGDREAREPGTLVWLSTKERGLHAVCYEDVTGRLRFSSASALRLSRLGETVPFHFEPSTDPFGPGSCVYFVSAGPEANPYGDEAVYELAIGDQGERMKVRDAAPEGERLSYYWERSRREENRYYQAALLDASDLWLWDVLFAPARKRYAFGVDELARSVASSRLTVSLQGASDFEAHPDHHLRLYVNGTLVSDVTWGGRTAKEVKVELGSGSLVEGENVLELENVGDTEAPYSMVFLDHFEVEYPRRLESDEGRLEGSVDASGEVRVAGIGAKGFVVDVTDEDQPSWLSGAQSTPEGALSFRAEAEARYLVLGADALRRTTVRQPLRSYLESPKNRADYLVVAPNQFLQEIQPLLRLRQQQGLRAQAVTVEQIYDEFGFGEERPEAIAEFLGYAYHHWGAPRLRYVLLVGDGTYDYKDHLRTGVKNRVAPLMVETSFLWTVSDPTLAAVNGDDILPDVAIGRLPAASEEEVRVMVEKILAYEAGGASLSGALVLVTDNPDAAGNFESSAAEVASGALSGRNVRMLHLGELGTSAIRNEIRKAFDDGASLMSYVGHGGIHLWASENIFNNADVASLSLQPQEPLFVTMNCLNGYFHFPYFNSLAEEVVKAEGKGAIAAFSPSGLSLNGPAVVFHQALLAQVFNQGHERLGDAVLAAQADYAASGRFPELLQIYHLLGDPGLSLRDRTREELAEAAK